MISLSAKIELFKSSENGGENGSINDVSFSSADNSHTNISSEIGAILGSKRRTAQPFVFGKSVLGKGGHFVSNAGYFIGRQLSDENGTFANQYTITISGTNINAVTIAFDDSNEGYPNYIEVDNETEYSKRIYDDDSVWTIPLETANTHTLTISNWNKPKSPLVISGIFIDLDITIDRRNKDYLDFSVFDRGDKSLPSYGIISNTGNINFIDVDGEIKDYSEQEILKSGLNVTIYLNDSLTKVKETIAIFKTATWNYDTDNRYVSLTVKDDLEEWQEITVNGINYDPSSPKSMTFKDIYEHLYNQTPIRFNMLRFNDLDEKTKEVLQNSVVQYPTMNNGTLWNLWNKVCQACLLHIYKYNGRTVCRYNGGN